VIFTAVRWYASYLLSATHVMQLLAERHIDVSARTVLNWVQTFGPQLAKALYNYRRRVGRQWYVDEVFCFRGRQKRYLYRAVDQHGQVIDILLRDKRDRASAAAFFRRTLDRTGVPPHMVVSDHHQPYSKRWPTPFLSPATSAPDCTGPRARRRSPLSGVTWPPVIACEGREG